MIDAADTSIHSTTIDGAAGSIIPVLRAEGAAACAAALVAYGHAGAGWTGFAVLFLAPDLSMLAYLAGGRWGARVYNGAHTTLCPAALACAGWFCGLPWLIAGALIWVAHIGFDRALGFGLKRGARFRDTHLGPAGRPEAAGSSVPDR